MYSKFYAGQIQDELSVTQAVCYSVVGNLGS